MLSESDERRKRQWNKLDPVKMLAMCKNLVHLAVNITTFNTCRILAAVSSRLSSLTIPLEGLQRALHKRQGKLILRILPPIVLPGARLLATPSSSSVDWVHEVWRSKVLARYNAMGLHSEGVPVLSESSSHEFVDYWDMIRAGLVY